MTARVLLATDQNIAWNGLRLLVSEQFNLNLVGEASTPRAAVQMAARHRPDVVVMDINIPLSVMIRTAREILQLIPDAKVITVSMQTDRLYVEKSLMSGISGYILKECAYEELLPAIRDVLSGKTFLSPEIPCLPA